MLKQHEASRVVVGWEDDHVYAVTCQLQHSYRYIHLKYFLSPELMKDRNPPDSSHQAVSIFVPIMGLMRR